VEEFEMATAKKTEEVKKVTKATPADAVAKVEAVKKAEAAKKAAAPAKKEAAPKTAAAKKETAPKEAPAKKEAAPAKKEAAPKAAAKKAAPAKVSEKVFIEFAGGQIEIAEIIDKVKANIDKKAVKELNVYYQPETGMVYYTADGESGSCSL